MPNRPPHPSRRDFVMTAAAIAVGPTTFPARLTAPKDGPIVRTAHGPVQGAVNQGGGLVFKGVPYAGSTGGFNRFRPPVAPRAWTAPLDATKPGPIAPQNDDDKIGAYAQFSQSEDCLNLNIWTPAADGAKRPVIMFMHGGGFTTGSGGVSLYDGSILAMGHDVVVVTINYRLGLLGFPPFQIHGPGVSNNLGVLDAIAALAWIRDNIAGFGEIPVASSNPANQPAP